MGTEMDCGWGSDGCDSEGLCRFGLEDAAGESDTGLEEYGVEVGV